MSAVVANVLLKLHDFLPGQIGDNRRWSTELVEALIMAADSVARERCETFVLEQEITLTDAENTYDLNSKFISVDQVEFSTDGSAYDDYLNPATMIELDQESAYWESDRGTQPDKYVLLCAPGVPETTSGASDGSAIIIYPSISSCDAQTIKVIGLAQGINTDNVPDEVQDLVYVPYVMSILLSSAKPDEAVERFQESLSGVKKVSSRFSDPYVERP